MRSNEFLFFKKRILISNFKPSTSSKSILIGRMIDESIFHDSYIFELIKEDGKLFCFFIQILMTVFLNSKIMNMLH